MIGVSFAGCAGWLHEANGSRGIVMCSPHGFEELCARRGWRVLGEKLAAAGMPTLRFDYHGTADSDGSSHQPNRVAAWRVSIREAIGWLERELGVSEVVIVGLRIGALLAALEAETQDRIAAVALLAPVMSGADYVRELEEMARGARHLREASRERPGIDIFGFHDHAETVAELEKLTFAALKHPPASEVLLVTTKCPAQSRLRRQLTGLGCNVVDDDSASFEKMVRDPFATGIDAAIDRVVSWAVNLGPMRQMRRPDVRSGELHGGMWREIRVKFGPARALAGVLCQPRYRRPSDPPVIFLNGGMSYHIGWARMTVDHSRALAAAGIPSLRMDCAGIGDSDIIFDPEVEPHLYSEAAAASLTSAVDWMEGHGHESPIVVGVGGDAYTAFHGIRLDSRIKGAVLVNLPCLYPSASDEVEGWNVMGRDCAAKRDNAAEEATEGRRSTSPTVASFAVDRLRSAVQAMKAVVRKRRLHFNDAEAWEARSWFAKLSKRGAEIMLVYSGGDPSFIEFERWAGPRGAAVIRFPGVSLRLIEDADRNLTPAHARAALLAHLSELLGLGEMPELGRISGRSNDRIQSDASEAPLTRSA